MRRSLALFSATALLALGWSTGCIPVEDLDLTQPNKVKKTLFTSMDENGNRDEWFFRQTIIDVPSTTGATFIGEQGTTERVVWEIEENHLFAYRAYPWLESEDGSADGYVRPGTGPYRGTPVAAYAIQSHFDVVRDFNAATGEQSNVIRENTTNRPWYERDYMRVDWSQNLITDFQFTASNVRQQGVTYFVPNEDELGAGNNKDALVLSDDYIDIVQAMTIEPEIDEWLSNYYGFPIPQCWLYTNIHYDCLGGTLKVRSSFMKAKPSTYVTQEFDDIRFRRFGYFRAERYGFDPEYGVVEPAAKRMSNRFSQWEDAGSCYDATAEHPYGDCDPSQLKPIVYYLNEDFPEEYKAGAISNGVEWNRVFKESILASTGWEASVIDDFDAYVICPNNPVKPDDHAACGYSSNPDENPNPQMGDLRYSMYYYITNEQTYSPLGYGPSAQDPLTGETIQGNAFYYGAPGKWIAARTRDIIKLELGLLDMEDITDGNPALANAGAYISGNNSSQARNALRADLSKVREFMDKKDFRNRAARVKHFANSGELLHDIRPARQAALEQSGLDEFIINDEIKKAFGVSENGSDVTAPAANVGKMFSPDFFRSVRDRENRLLNPKAGGCILMAEDIFDMGLTGLINTIRNAHYESDGAGGWQLRADSSEEEMFNDIVMRTMQDTQLHEIGHTVGLRHNFSGSTDALNFGPEYWELKGPGYLMGQNDERPVGEWELTGNYAQGFETALANGIRDYQDSSVMDYASTYGTNTVLGTYDAAAIKYAYGDVVEIFDNVDWVNLDGDGNRTAETQERIDLMKQGEVHYTYLPEIVSNAGTYQERINDVYTRRNVNFRFTDERFDDYDPSLVEVPYSMCSDEYRGASARCFTWDQGVDTYERSTKMVQDYRNYYIFDAFKRQRVTFGVSVFNYLSRLYSRRFFFLANQYKQWVNDELIIRADRPCVWYENGVRQEDATNGHSFADQCGLEGFIGAAAGLNLLTEVLQTPDQGCYVRLQPGCYSSTGTNETGISGEEITLIDADPDACIGLDTGLGDDSERYRAIRITEQTPFRHVEDSVNCDNWNPANPDLYEEAVSLGIAEGAKPSITTYDRDKFGYYFYWKALNMGHWWDKWAASMALGDPAGDYIGTDASSDTRAYLINFLTLFGDDLNNITGGIVAERADVYGGQIVDGKFQAIPTVGVFTGDVPDRTGGGIDFIDPDQQYTFRLIALMNGAYSGWYTDDVEFGETIRMGATLQQADIAVDPAIQADPARYAQLTDPVTGQIWFAVNSVREFDQNADDELFSTAYEMIREIKDKYYVGGADGDGTTLIDDGFLWQPRSEIRMLNIIRSTANTMGYNTDVWSGTVFY